MILFTLFLIIWCDVKHLILIKEFVVVIFFRTKRSEKIEIVYRKETKMITKEVPTRKSSGVLIAMTKGGS